MFDDVNYSYSRMPKDTSVYQITAAALLAAMLTTGAVAQERRVLTGHVPAQAAKAVAVGRLPSTNSLDLAIGLPLRDQAAVTRFVQDIYDPASPNYRHYLTSEQFDERFGPTESDYQAVIAFAKAHNLAVTGTIPIACCWMWPGESLMLKALSKLRCAPTSIRRKPAPFMRRISSRRSRRRCRFLTSAASATYGCRIQSIANPSRSASDKPQAEGHRIMARRPIHRQ